MSLRIGVDARLATESAGGIGTYVRELISQLCHEAHRHELSLYSRQPWEPLRSGDRCRWELLPGSDVSWNLRVARHANQTCDVYLATNSFLASWFLRIPTVTVVHDMIPFESRHQPNQRSARVHRLTMPWALRRATGVIAVSESTRTDLVERFPGAAAKTSVVYEAAQRRFGTDESGDEEIRARHGLDEPYVLAVGTLEPRKNLPRLIEAFGSLSDRARDGHELVLVGAAGWRTHSTFRALRRHGTHVKALGYVPDGDLPAVYRGATLLVFPSLYEGFGLPVLEAMQSGTPVLASRTSSIPEVGGDAISYIDDPRSTEDIRSGLEALLLDRERRARLKGLGLARSERFSWSLTTRATLAKLEAAAGT